MAPTTKKPSTTAEVSLLPLKNCLVNLPASLVAVLGNVNVVAQNVVVELQYQSSMLPAGASGNKTPRSAYVGWTGMPSRPRPGSVVGRKGAAGRGSEQEISRVEIDSIFAGLLGLVEGQRIEISLHLEPPTAHTVNVEPLTPSDWEVIELHGNFLELNLLSQVRALPNPDYSRTIPPQAAHSHPLTLHLSPTSTVKVIVTSLTPSIPSSSPFAKISSDAEVVVAPKLRPRASRGNREDDRSVGSMGRRSAKSGGNSLPPRISPGKDIVLFRSVDRTVCYDWFSPDCGEDNHKNLIVWVSNEALDKEALRGRKWVLVSIIRPTGLRAPLDQHQMQQLKEQESSEARSPSIKATAELRSWADAPDEQHAGLSHILCRTLGVDGLVGGVVALEAAPDPLPRLGTTRVKLYPFLPDALPKKEGLRFGGDTKLSKQAMATRVKEIYGTREGLFGGPISDGMMLPPSSGEANASLRFAGGIIRLESSSTSGQSKEQPFPWLLGSDHNLVLDVQAEIPRSMAPTTLFPTLGSTVPKDRLDLVGIDHIVTKCMSNLTLGSSVLLTGGTGSGKTSLACLLCKRLSEEELFNATYFSCRELVTDETRVSTVSDTLTRLFMSASWCARPGGQSIVVLDDLDKICPVETELQVGNDNGRSRLVTEILCSIVRYYCVPGSDIVLLATAPSKDSLNHIVVSGHVVGEIIDLKAPDKEARRKILERVLKPETSLGNATMDGHKPDPSTHLEHHNEEARSKAPCTDSGAPVSSAECIILSPSVDLLDLAGRTDGFMPSDLKLLVSRARSECLIRVIAEPVETSSANLTLSRPDFAAALKNFTPSALRTVPLTRSTTTFSSVGGHAHTRTTLLETLLYPTKYAPIFSSCPLRLRSGILLYGYPGCGKTLLASAVAGECGLNFISVKGPEILNKYIGASEKSVRDLFERAQTARPCVLFFDEFDSVAPKRGHDSTGVTDRVVNQLLTQMDGAEGSEGVYVLAATSRPDLIDPALLRPGRLDKSLLCDMPDRAERIDILSAVSKEKLTLDTEVEEGLGEIAARTEAFSGADLQALMYNAHLEAVHEFLAADKSSRHASSSSNKANTTNGSASKKVPRPVRKGRGNTGSRRKGEKEANDEDFMQFLYDPEADAAARDSGPGSGPNAVFEPPTLVAEKIAAIRSTERLERRQQHPFHLFSSGANGHAYHGDQDQDQDQDQDENQDRNQTERTVVIKWANIQRALASTRPSISPHEKSRLEAIYHEFVVGRNGEMPSGDGGREVGGRSSLM